MRKKLLPLIILFLSLNLTSCTFSKDNQSENKTQESTINTTLPPEKPLNFSIGGPSTVPSNFITQNDTIIFPNWDNNNVISKINKDDFSNVINDTLIKESYNYSTDSLVIYRDTLFFANNSNNNYLSTVSSNGEDFKVLAKTPVRNLILQGSNIYFINRKSENLSSYNIDTTSIGTITTDRVGKYIINGNYALYQNLSDNASLYIISLDGKHKKKVTNFSVESFTTLNNKIILTNSDDNNKIYSLDPITNKTLRISNIKSFDLKSYDGTGYFINNEDNNSLYSLEYIEKNDTIKINRITSNSINEYHLSKEGIFYRQGLNINNIYYTKYN